MQYIYTNCLGKICNRLKNHQIKVYRENKTTKQSDREGRQGILNHLTRVCVCVCETERKRITDIEYLRLDPLNYTSLQMHISEHDSV